MRAAPIVCAILGGLLLVAQGPSRAEAAARIEWRLENPFRLFKKPEHTELHRQAFEKLNAAERQLPILSAERRLEARFAGRGWAEQMFNDTCYSRADNRYTGCKDYVLPKSHRIVAQVVGEDSFFDLFLPAQPKGGTCKWQLSAEGKLLDSATAPCDKPVTLDVPYPGGGRLSVKREAADAAPAIAIKVRDVLIVGLGDSFGAGEGNPDDPVSFSDSRSHDYGKVDIAATGATERLDGYPARQGTWTQLSGADFNKERARWWDRECHRSLYSHQFRAALQLAVEDPKRAITFLSYACSGAEITQGLLLNTSVRECRAGETFSVPAQMSSASEDLCRSVTTRAPMPAAIIERMPELRSIAERDMRISRCARPADDSTAQAALKRPIDLVMLSVGGNDVGFVPLISDSILSETSIYRSLGQRMDTVYGVDRARTRLEIVKRRFDGLKYSLDLFLGVNGTSSDRKVILTGYPNMGYAADGMSSCEGTKGLEVFPPFRLDAAKVGKADEFTSELNESLEAIAGSNWTYVDGYTDDFRARGLCATRGDKPAETLDFPRLKDGVWTPYKPSLYPAYTPRQRWVRTPNDAFLTTNMHAETVATFGANCSSLFTGTLKTLARRYWSPFQIFLASTYGGAFHPTAEGQARIADDVAEAARIALARTH